MESEKITGYWAKNVILQITKLIWENTETGYDDGSLEQTKWW